MEDHGQLITHFEELFGETVDHEVIKMILQACDWNSKDAHEQLVNISGVEQTKSSSDIGLDDFTEPYSTVLSKNKFEVLEDDTKYKNNQKKERAVTESDTPASNIDNVVTNGFGNNDVESYSKYKFKTDKIEKIERLIASEARLLVIMRGLPGSGKSTLANSLRKNGIVLSTDDYFYDKFKNYNFNPNVLHEAHRWNRDRAKICIHNGITPIFIDNTNLELWEFGPYIKIALMNDYYIDVLEPETHWKYNASELYRKCIHNIPKKKIEEMKERYCYANLSIDKELKMLLGSSQPATSLQINGDNVLSNGDPHLLNGVDSAAVAAQSSSSEEEIAIPVVDERNYGSITRKTTEHPNQVYEEREFDRVNSYASEENGVNSEEEFTDLVDSFGRLVKKRIEKNKLGCNDIPKEEKRSDDYPEDEAMYRLCTDFEDKLGKPLLSLKNSKSECLKLNLKAKKSDNNDKVESDSSLKEQTVNGPTGDWDCMNGDSATHLSTWDADKKMTNHTGIQDGEQSTLTSKPSRNKKRESNSLQWLSDCYSEEKDEQDMISWDVVEGNEVTWETEVKENSIKATTPIPSLPHTGAVPKRSPKVQHAGPMPNPLPVTKKPQSKTSDNKETQFCTSDYSCNTDLKILKGDPSSFVPGSLEKIEKNEPLTKDKLLLSRSTMTDEIGQSSVGGDCPLEKLTSFFPALAKDDLEDMLEKCDYDMDWAMNVLIDGGYKLSDPSDKSKSFDSDNEKDAASSIDAEESLSGEQINVAQVPCEQNKKSSILGLQKAKSIDNSVNSAKVVDRLKQWSKNDGDRNGQVNKQVKENGKSKESSPGVASNSSLNQTETDSEDGTDTKEGSTFLSMEVDPLFATQLINIYGPISSLNLSTGLTNEDRKIVLPLNLCFEIYRCWAETLEGKFQHEDDVFAKLIKDDEELARKLQEEENNQGITDSFHRDPPTSLREIMQLEEALQKSNKTSHKNENKAYSEILSLKKLQEEFSHVDPVAVECEYQTHEFDYNATRTILIYKFGPSNAAVAPKVVVDEKIELEENGIDVNEDWSVSDMVADDPQAYRDEAQMHYRQRKAAFNKAQEASQQGMKSVASYYAQLGNMHTIKFKEANERAYKKILSAFNADKGPNTLDLHLLHVDEALREVQSFLVERKSIVSNKRLKELVVHIITGKGNHSGGKSKLKPAVAYFLKNEGYTFHEGAGVIKVYLKSQTQS